MTIKLEMLNAILLFFITLYIIMYTLMKKYTNKSFLSLLLIFFTISILQLLKQVINHSLIITMLLKLTTTGYFFINIFYILFIYEYLGKHNAVIGYASLFLFVMLLVVTSTTNLVISGNRIIKTTQTIIPGIIYHQTIFVFEIVPLLYSLIFLLHKMIKDKTIQKELYYLLSAIVITLVSSICDILMIMKFTSYMHFHFITMFIKFIPIVLIFHLLLFFNININDVRNMIKTIFAHMHDGVIIINNQNYITNINETAKLMFSLEEDELKDLKITHLLPAYNRNAVYIDYELDSTDYRKFIAISHSNIIQNNISTGKLIILRDITPQKVLDEIWHRYQFIVNSSKQYIALIRKDYSYALVNDALIERFNNITPNNIYLKVSDLWGQEYFDTICQDKLSHCFNGENQYYEGWFTLKNEEKKYLTIEYYPYYNINNEITHIIEIAYDITELKKTEQLLKEANTRLEVKIEDRTKKLKLANTKLLHEIEQRKKGEKKIREAHSKMKQLLSSINSMVISLSIDKKIIHFNPKAEHILGQQKKDTIGKSLDELKLNWEINVINHGIDECVKRLVGIRLKELSFIDKNGKNHLLGLHINPMRNNENSLDGIIIWGTDITERKILEAQLNQAQRMESIGLLAAGIAHEINTPIQYIQDNLYFFKDSFNNIIDLITTYKEVLLNNKNKSLPDEKLDEIQAIDDKNDINYLITEIPNAITQSLDGVERVSKIIKSMRDFSYPVSEEKKFININKAIESTLIISRNEWKYDAEITTDFDTTLHEIPCYPGELNQVILNLIINSAHAIHESRAETDGPKGTINISTKKVGNWGQIKISDNGIGIPDDIKDKIFAPFFTTKDVGKGTGQGLAISYGVIVEKHKGKLFFKSKKGIGTDFYIRIPLK